MFLKKIFFTLLFANLAAVTTLFASITVAPLSITLSDRNPSGSVIVHNPSGKHMFVKCELRFGYPASDDTGRTFIHIVDTLKGDEPSAVDWVRWYPRSVVLKPGEDQRIRFTARPPANLPAREYWARIVFTSSEVPDVNKTFDTTAAVRTAITMATQTIVALQYRRGKVNTGAELELINIKRTGDSLKILLEMKPTGNAYFWGSLRCKLFDSKKKVISDYENGIAIYYSLRRTIYLPIPAVKKGEYSLEAELVTERKSGSKRDALKVPPVKLQIPIPPEFYNN